MVSLLLLLSISYQLLFVWARIDSTSFVWDTHHNPFGKGEKISIDSISYPVALFLVSSEMECRLVLYSRSSNPITDHDLKGQLHQDLKHFKFRRVPAKNGKTVIYLFFRREEETYFALRKARSLPGISVVRYRPSLVVPYEHPFRPSPPQRIIDIIRFGLQQHVKKFLQVVGKSKKSEI